MMNKFTGICLSLALIVMPIEGICEGPRYYKDQVSEWMANLENGEEHDNGQAEGELTYKNEPNGFRDLYWGESLEKIKQTRNVKYLNYNAKTNKVSYIVYFREDEPSHLSRVPVTGRAMLASLWNNRLTDITLYFYEKNAFSDLKYAMHSMFGKPFMDLNNQIYWAGNKTVIILMAPENNNPCILYLNSSQLTKEAMKTEAKSGW